MSDIRFCCACCKNPLVVDEAGVGLSVPCPACGREITIPTETAGLPAINKVRLQNAAGGGLGASLLSESEITDLRGQIERTARFTVGISEAWTLNQIVGNILDVTSGKASYADARQWISKLTDDEGFELGQDWAELIVDTLTGTAHGYIRKKHDYAPDWVELFPGWELYRVGEREHPRNWPERWTRSCKDAGDETALRVFNKTGRMVALKSSGVWDSLGNSDLWDDALDVSYPPFYFNSGVFGINSLSPTECRELGLLKPGETPKPRGEFRQPRDFPTDNERMTRWLENQPQQCAHCEEMKPGKLVCEWCENCGDSICAECATKVCPHTN